jgi:NitT/TauT family transport system permease protein
LDDGKTGNAWGEGVWIALSFLLLFGLWEIAGLIPINLAFPRFSSVAAALWEMMLNGEFAKAYAQTLPPLLIGIGAVFVGGVLAGIVMGLSRSFEWMFMPLMVILQTAPMAALIPLVTFLYGIGLASKVMAVVILAAPLVVLNSYQGIRDTSASLLDMCRSFQGTRHQQIVKIMLPYASGMIFAGLRLGLSAGFIGIILAELLITPTGIGDLITYNRSIARYDKMFAAIVSIIVLSAVTLAVLQRVESRAFGRGRFQAP